MGLLGDLGAIVEQITAAAGKTPGADIRPWVDQLREDRSAWRANLESRATGESPMHPLDVYTRIEHLLDRDTVVVLDGGDYVQWGRCYFKARHARTIHSMGP